MLRVFTLTAILVFASAFAFAETFSGTLVDAACSAQQNTATCAPTAATVSFALQVAGKTLKLDADGNKKAADALKNSSSSADRAKDPNAANSQVMAKVDGTQNGDEIKVDTISIQ
jgi:hypothetical protein